MPALLFQPDPAELATPVSDEFILHQMPQANGNYVKVYLYVFQRYFRAVSDFSTRDIASALNMLESDVLQALQYWNDQGSLSLRADGEQLWLSFPSYHSTAPRGPEPGHTQPDHSKVVHVERKPTYSPEEINIYEQNPMIQDLFAFASRALGEQFSFPNLSLLFSFYDYYRLPVNVIKYLIEYCLHNGNRSLRYMEKVAQDWSDHGICTVEAAKAYVKRFDVYRPILKALGIADRQPSDGEIECMERWTDQYGFGTDLILEAAGRTLRKTGKPSFKYMDSILKSWSEQHVQSLQDVSRLDEAFAAKKAAAGNAPAAAHPPKGAFHTYSNRNDWDFESIEKRAQDQLYYQERN